MNNSLSKEMIIYLFNEVGLDKSSIEVNNHLLEYAISPDDYVVGPGDIFSFSMLSSDGIINIDLD